MVESPSFTDSIVHIMSGLREGSPSYTHLNHAVSQIDHLGRLLHGIGYVRDREIAACFTAAIGELQVSIELPEGARAATVQQASWQLETALAHTAEGVTQ